MIYLLPNLLDPDALKEFSFPPALAQIVPTLTGLIAESERGSRTFLKQFSTHIPIFLLNEHTKDADIADFIHKFSGKWGLISDGGLPCLADPGAKLVALARKKNIPIKAISGPCSITLALMLSGIPSQSFTFHGYPDKDLLSLEKNHTHIFIEAPYRNQKFLEQLIKTLPDKTLLCTATDLTAPTEEVHTFPISAWKKYPLPQINKRPTVFLFLTQNAKRKLQNEERIKNS